jgi:hypothetical protein
MLYHVIRCSRNSVRSTAKRIQMRRSQATEGEEPSSKLWSLLRCCYFYPAMSRQTILSIKVYPFISHPILFVCCAMLYPVIQCYTIHRNAMLYFGFYFDCSPVLLIHAMLFSSIHSNTRLTWVDTDCWRSFCVSRRTSRILSWACPSASNKLLLVSALHTSALQYTALKYTTLFHTALFCTALHNAVLHFTALHCTILHCAAQRCTALHFTALYCTALHNAVLHFTALHYTALRCTTLYCTSLH